MNSQNNKGVTLDCIMNNEEHLTVEPIGLYSVNFKFRLDHCFGTDWNSVILQCDGLKLVREILDRQIANWEAEKANV